MTRTKTIAALAAFGLLGGVFLAPSPSSAFSFGTFAPGEKVLSIQLAAGNLANPTITFDGTLDTMVFDATVSTITTNLATYNIPLGDVLFSSSVTIVGGTEMVIPPFPGFGGQLSAEFANGITADLSILDMAGSTVLLEGDYIGSLGFVANSPGGSGFPIVGSLNGDFSVSGGDPIFTAAFGSSGNYFTNLASFIASGTPVGSNLCLMISGGCSGTTIGSFTVNPAATITPIPEPGVAALLALGLLGLAGLRGFTR